MAKLTQPQKVPSPHWQQHTQTVGLGIYIVYIIQAEEQLRFGACDTESRVELPTRSSCVYIPRTSLDALALYSIDRQRGNNSALLGSGVDQPMTDENIYTSSQGVTYPRTMRRWCSALHVHIAIYVYNARRLNCCSTDAMFEERTRIYSARGEIW